MNFMRLFKTNNNMFYFILQYTLHEYSYFNGRNKCNLGTLQQHLKTFC